jgi:hypothetical protein
MGILDKIGEQMGGSILSGVKELITIWKVPAEKVLEAQQEQDKVVAAMQTKVLDIVQTEMQGQMDINKVEAANPNIFVSGWRPFVGWTCGSGLALMFVVRPMCMWIANLCGHPVDFPQLDMSVMLELLLGMLGMGGLRTYEKLKGVAAK